MNEQYKVADGQEGKPIEEKVIEITKTETVTTTFAVLDEDREGEIAELQRQIDALTAKRDEKRAAWDAEKAKLV